VAIVVFPGSNCEQDVLRAFGCMGVRAEYVWHHATDLGGFDAVVLPGLCNAHTHLELSYLRDEVPPAPAFVTWIRGVMKARRQRPIFSPTA